MSKGTASKLSGATVKMDSALQRLSLCADSIPDSVWGDIQQSWADLIDASNEVIQEAKASA